ncbi:MAG: synthase epsilon chain [Rhizobacter sp.]|nr:synthase epsilon chain [Rhizobacter sp.]
MQTPCIDLEVMVPSQVFVRAADITSLVVPTRDGALGLLPHRLDGVAAVRPGILVCRTESRGEVFIAVDEGVMVKTGKRVRVSVRRALAGTDLAALHEAVERQYLSHSDEETNLRSVMDRLEAGFLLRFSALGHG